jgi:pyruvate kinase
MRRAKIVCTLGPASSSAERIGELIDAGMNVARLNFSHGDHQDHLKLFQTVRSEAERRGRAVAILCDLQGPKIRVGRFKDGQVPLKAGESFIITTQDVEGTAGRVSTTYAGLPQDVRIGDHLLLDDGLLTLAVTDIVDHEVHTVVITGGILKNNKGINLPNVEVSAPALTEKDRKDLSLALRLGADYIALSFVRKPEDIQLAQSLATADEQRIPIIAKIEKPQAIDCLEDIIDVADGIMVARGDLGVEMGPEKVPLIQKRIIDLTNSRGKLVITATQMLESMMHNPRPTRAEASDVANAVLDGTDAVMLSGETAAGKYPIETVKTMARIITEIETSPAYYTRMSMPDFDLPVEANAIAHAAVIAAQRLGLGTIAVVTGSGGAARLMSEYRPQARIIALTSSEQTYRRLAPYWGVTPIHFPLAATTDELLSTVERVLREHDLAQPGEKVVVTAGLPVGSGVMTNTLQLHNMP